MEYDSARGVWAIGAGDKAWLLDGPSLLDLTGIKIQLVTAKWIYYWVTDRNNPRYPLGHRARIPRTAGLVVPRSEAWIHEGKRRPDAPKFVVR